MKIITNKNLGCLCGVKDFQLFQSINPPFEPNYPFLLVGFRKRKNKKMALITYPNTSDVFMVPTSDILIQKVGKLDKMLLNKMLREKTRTFKIKKILGSKKKSIVIGHFISPKNP